MMITMCQEILYIIFVISKQLMHDIAIYLTKESIICIFIDNTLYYK